MGGARFAPLVGMCCREAAAPGMRPPKPRRKARPAKPDSSAPEGNGMRRRNPNQEPQPGGPGIRSVPGWSVTSPRDRGHGGGR